MFSEKDLQQIISKGIDPVTIQGQMDHFRTGFPFVELLRPAGIGNGIIELNELTAKTYSHLFEKDYKELEIIKFVPASGAASRMFRHLFHFLEHFNDSHDSMHKLLHDHGLHGVWYFMENLKKFAFYQDLKEVLSQHGFDIVRCLENKEYQTIITYLLNPEGLDYGNLPKGLLKFHHEGDKSRTAIEEHLVEGMQYSCDANMEVHVHFTLSPEHIDKFREHIDKVLPEYSRKFRLKFDISWSVQRSSTDTLAVDLENQPFRDKNGELVFRPGGHGALIENLNELKADLIFIKNIDNVVPDHWKATTILYKKALGGLLLHLQRRAFGYLAYLDQGGTDEDKMKEIRNFSVNELFISLPVNFDDLTVSERAVILFEKLDRPIRVCGMVKNEGEPGGGPFWTRNSKGEISLQIIESSQVDMDNLRQKEIAHHASHFNPVDLVCGTRDFMGSAYDLRKFIDPETGFISQKSKDGKILKAQELPGLWNGAMADWITVFAEVPVLTFNPVKTVNDLLRKEHQSG